MALNIICKNNLCEHLCWCDDDTDGFGLFDLSLSNEEVLNGLDPSEFTITYYETPEVRSIEPKCGPTYGYT